MAAHAACGGLFVETVFALAGRPLRRGIAAAFGQWRADRGGFVSHRRSAGAGASAGSGSAHLARALPRAGIICAMSFNPLDYPLALAQPRLFSGTSTWTQHIPLAFALVQMQKPTMIVEQIGRAHV